LRSEYFMSDVMESKTLKGSTTAHLRVNKKQEILQAATGLFAAQGFDGTTTLQISREAGIEAIPHSIDIDPVMYSAEKCVVADARILLSEVKETTDI